MNAKDIMKNMRKENLTVVDIIKRMKHLSSLIMDLAFAALVTGDKGLAKHVAMLEEEMDVLQYQLEIGVMLATRNWKDAENFTAINRIASAMEDISDGAEELVDAVIRGFPIEKSISQALAEEMQLKVYKVGKTKFLGKTTDELSKSYEIIGLKKAGKWIYMPKENFVLDKGDMIILRKR